MAFRYNTNVDKLVETVRKELKEIRAYLSEEAKTGGEKEKERVEQLDVAITLGEKAGRWSAVEKIRDAIKNDPSKFIRSLKDLKFDSSYLDDLFNEYQQVKNKSSMERIKTSVDVARKLHLAKDIGAQEQTFIDKIDYVKIKDVVASSTEAELLWRNVWLPAFAKGSIDYPTAKAILQNALDKLTSSNWQTQVEAQDNNQEQIQKQTQDSEEKKEEKENIKVFAEGVAVSELLAEMIKSEKRIEDLIKSIKEADPKLLQKANAAILQFSAESQAILNKVDLSKEEREQLQKLQEQLNSAVEEKAKELHVSTKTLTVSDKHLKATEEHIENLMNRKEEEYVEVITKYRNTIIKIFAEEYNIPEESIEKLEEFISRHTALAKAQRKGSNEEKGKTKIEGFDYINPLNQNKQ